MPDYCGRRLSRKIQDLQGKRESIKESGGLEYAGIDTKKGESLVINNNIEITVLEIRGDQVKIGISAPKEVPIYRKEVYLQIQEENKAALDVDTIEALKNLF